MLIRSLHIWFSYIFIFIYIHYHRVYDELTIDHLSMWLGSSVDRALHRIPFKPEFFFVLLFQVESTLRISQISLTINCHNFIADAMAYRGDLIGCTVKFDLAKDGKVPIVFSLNGRRITQDETSMEYSQNEKFLYPYIGMGRAGIRVLAKVSS